MEMITHSTWKLVRASGSQSENVCQYQEHFLNPTHSLQLRTTASLMSLEMNLLEVRDNCFLRD